MHLYNYEDMPEHVCEDMSVHVYEDMSVHVYEDMCVRTCLYMCMKTCLYTCVHVSCGAIFLWGKCSWSCWKLNVMFLMKKSAKQVFLGWTWVIPEKRGTEKIAICICWKVVVLLTCLVFTDKSWWLKMREVFHAKNACCAMYFTHIFIKVHLYFDVGENEVKTISVWKSAWMLQTVSSFACYTDLTCRVWQPSAKRLPYRFSLVMGHLLLRLAGIQEMQDEC